MGGDSRRYLPVFLAHRSALNWTDPERFEPERFLQQQRRQSGEDSGAAGANTTAAAHDETRSWFPFSAGRRDCVGRRFAMQEGVLLLARLVHAFDFDFPPGCGRVAFLI